MKKLVYLFLSSVLFVSACGSSNTKELKENLVVSEFAIEGMVCAMGCAKTIEEEISALNGVKVSLVDFESGKAHFEYDKSQLSETELIAKIEKLADGQYKVDKWEELEHTSNTEQSPTGESSVVNEKKSEAKVVLPSFQIPNLFTFLINQV